jgi:hypothetical protein
MLLLPMRNNFNHAAQNTGTRRFHVWFWALVTLLMAFHLPAQTAPAQSSSRFLFIVDISSPMKRNSADVLKVMNEIISSSASGQIHPGDTLGLWTFDQDVASDLPVQQWVPGEEAEIALRTVTYLRPLLIEKPGTVERRQPFDKGTMVNRSPATVTKPSRFDKVLPDMFTLIQGSDALTIFIISTGEGKIRGSPFDNEINGVLQQSIRDMNGKRLPIVTVLQAHAGQLVHYTVNPLPWPLVMPPPLPPSHRLLPVNLPSRRQPSSRPRQFRSP